MDMEALCHLIYRRHITASVFVLFIIADELAVVITQCYHVHILVFLVVIISVHDIVFFIGVKPIQDPCDNFLRFAVVAIKQAFAEQGRASALFIT